MNKSKAITDGALLTAVYIILLLIVVFIPFIQILGIFILSVPFIIYTGKHGIKFGSVMLLVSIIFSLVFATAFSLPITLLTGIGGVVLGAGIHAEKKAYEVWAQGTLGFIVGLVAVLAVLQLLLSINIFDQIDAIVIETTDMMKSITEQLQMGSQYDSQIKILKEQMLEFKNLIPSSMAISGMLFAVIGQWSSYKVLNRIEQANYRFPPFKKLNFPIAIIWIYFVTILLSLLDLDHDSGFYVVVANVTALLVVLIIIQGFSFIFFFADYKNIHQSVPIIIVFATLLLPFLFIFIVEMIGIIDLGFGLKKRFSEKKS